VNAVLETIYSLPFLIGLLVGMGGQRAYCLIKARRADKRHPLPGGGHRRVGGISMTWVGGLVAVGVLGYVLLQVDQTETHYRQLGDEMRRCQIEFNTALRARAAITTENDQLSREQRDLLAESDEAESTWISRLINLPEDIASLTPDDPRRQDYGQTITRVYFERATKINLRITAISDRQRQLDQERLDHPLPEPTCGR
jgi:hypothetical protein